MNINVRNKYLWHISAIYCVTFDRSGNFIFTGGDDGMVKVYSINEDKLVAELTDGNSFDDFKRDIEEFYCDNRHEKKYDIKGLEKNLNNRFAITDLAVNLENTILAAGKFSGVILVWELQNGSLLTRLDRHTSPINSLHFSSQMLDCDNRFLISTSEDGVIHFWRWNTLSKEFIADTDIKKAKHDNLSCIETAHSSGGLLVAVALRNSYQYSIRINSFEENFALKDVWNIVWQETHSDCVFTLKFSNKSIRFASGCNRDKDTYIWNYDGNNKWTKIIIQIREKRAHSALGCVEEIIWTCDDSFVISALTDFSIKVFHSLTGDNVCKFQSGHTAKIVVLSAHPTDGNLFMSASHDGRIIIWNILAENFTMKFESKFVPITQELGNGGNSGNNSDSNKLNPWLFDCRFSPNAKYIASGDNYGNLNNISFYDDCLDRLEDTLERLHSENSHLVPALKDTQLTDLYDSFRVKYDLERDLLNGKQLIQSTNVKDKSLEDKSIKVIQTKQTNSDEVKQKKTRQKSDSTDDEKDKKTPQRRKVIIGAKRWKETVRTKCKKLLKEILDNPLSKPFIFIDPVEYPSYRKEISDSDVHLSSIHEEINGDDYSFARFRKDMCLVFDNAKQFFADKDKSVADAAVVLRKIFDVQIRAILVSEGITPTKKLSKGVMSNGDKNCDKTNNKRKQTIDSSVYRSESSVTKKLGTTSKSDSQSMSRTPDRKRPKIGPKSAKSGSDSVAKQKQEKESRISDVNSDKVKNIATDEEKKQMKETEPNLVADNDANKRLKVPVVVDISENSSHTSINSQPIVTDEVLKVPTNEPQKQTEVVTTKEHNNDHEISSTSEHQNNASTTLENLNKMGIKQCKSYCEQAIKYLNTISEECSYLSDTIKFQLQKARINNTDMMLALMNIEIENKINSESAIKAETLCIASLAILHDNSDEIDSYRNTNASQLLNNAKAKVSDCLVSICKLQFKQLDTGRYLLKCD